MMQSGYHDHYHVTAEGRQMSSALKGKSCSQPVAKPAMSLSLTCRALAAASTDRSC